MASETIEVTLSTNEFVQLIAKLLDSNITSQAASLLNPNSFAGIQEKYSQPKSTLESNNKSQYYYQSYKAISLPEIIVEMLIGKFINLDQKTIEFIFDNDYLDVKRKLINYFNIYENMNSYFKHAFAWNSENNSIFKDITFTFLIPQIILLFHNTNKNLPTYSPILMFKRIVDKSRGEYKNQASINGFYKIIETILKEEFNNLLPYFQGSNSGTIFDKNYLELDVKPKSSLTHATIANHIKKLIRHYNIATLSEIQRTSLTNYYSLIYACGIILRAIRILDDNAHSFLRSIINFKAKDAKNIGLIKSNIQLLKANETIYYPHHFSIHSFDEVKHLNSLFKLSSLPGLSQLLQKTKTFVMPEHLSFDMFLFLENADYSGVIHGDDFSDEIKTLNISTSAKSAIDTCIKALNFIVNDNLEGALTEIISAYTHQDGQQLGKLNTLIIMIYIGLHCSQGEFTRAHDLDVLLKKFILSLPIRTEVVVLDPEMKFHGAERYELNIQAICDTHSQKNINKSVLLNTAKLFHDYNKLIFALKNLDFRSKLFIHPLRDAEGLAQQIIQYLMEVNTKMSWGDNTDKRNKVTIKFRTNCIQNVVTHDEILAACEDITYTQLQNAKPKYFPHSFIEILTSISFFIDILYPVSYQQHIVPSLIEFSELPKLIQKQIIETLNLINSK